MTERDEIWYDPDAPGRRFGHRMMNTIRIVLSIGMFLQWVVWTHSGLCGHTKCS